MSTPKVNPVSERYPFDLAGKVDPEVDMAHRYAFQGLVDVNQAIAALKDQITTLQKGSGSGSSTSTTNASSTGVTVSQANSIAQQQASTTIANTLGPVNNQTGTAYTVQSSDYGGIITMNNASASTVTLNPVLQHQFFTGVQNLGAGTVTLQPGTGVGGTGTINGTATLNIAPNEGVLVYYDGINWWAVTPSTAAAGVTSLDGIAGAVTLVAGSGITITDNSPSPGDITIAASGGGGGVTSLDSITGAINLIAGSGVTITDNSPSPGDITIASTGGGGGYLKGSGSITVGTSTPDGNVYSGTATVTGATVGQAALAVGAALGLANNITILSAVVTAANTVSLGVYFPTNFSSLSGGVFVPQVNVLIIVFP